MTHAHVAVERNIKNVVEGKIGNRYQVTGNR